MRGKRILWMLIGVAALGIVVWPFFHVWTARPGDVLSEKDITSIRLYSDPWWQKVHDQPWCGPVEGFTACELQGERLQEFVQAIEQPGPSQYVWGSPSQGADLEYSIEVVFRDGDHRYLSVYKGMPTGTFYGVGPNVRVYTGVVSEWRYENGPLAVVAESMLSK